MTSHPNPAVQPKQAIVRNLLGGVLMGLANLRRSWKASRS